MAIIKKKKVVVGGTFDILHKGHKAFLRKAFSLGEVTIGLTSDVWAENIKKRKVKEFKDRKKELEDFAKKEFMVKPRIVKIEDKFGPTLKEDFDYIVVSPETYPGAVSINLKRRNIKKKPIKIIKIEFVLDKDKKPISATKILKRYRKIMKENKVEILNNFHEKLKGIENAPEAALDKYPTVILTHGFAAEKTEEGMFDDIAKSLTEDGFSVYRFDFSGCGESEGDYSKTSLTKLIKDLRSIIDFVKKQPKVDSDRLGLVGMSFGTTVAIGLNAPEIKSYVLLGSVANPYEVLKNLFQQYTFNPEGESFRITSEGRRIKMGPQFWQDLLSYNLLKKISEIRKPICIIHGEKDSAAPLQEAKIFYQNAKEPKKLVIIKNSDHGFYQSIERREMIKELTDWFKKYLLI